jgi:hypothetical protein
MHVRYTLITTDPERTGEAIAYLVSDGRSRLGSEPGENGMSLQASPDLAVAVLESYWASHDAMRDSERAEASVRDTAIRLALGTASRPFWSITGLDDNSAKPFGATSSPW